MSKRVSNKKGKQRVTPARSEVRLGWRRKLLEAQRQLIRDRIKARLTVGGWGNQVSN